MATHVIIAFVPPYLQRSFPTHEALDAVYATVVGVSATVSAVLIGVICEVRAGAFPMATWVFSSDTLLHYIRPALERGAPVHPEL